MILNKIFFIFISATEAEITLFLQILFVIVINTIKIRVLFETLFTIFGIFTLLSFLSEKFSQDVLAFFSNIVHKSYIKISTFLFIFFLFMIFFLFLRQGLPGVGLFTSLIALYYLYYSFDNPLENYSRISTHFALFFLNNYVFIMITFTFFLFFFGKISQFAAFISYSLLISDYEYALNCQHLGPNVLKKEHNLTKNNILNPILMVITNKPPTNNTIVVANEHNYTGPKRSQSSSFFMDFRGKAFNEQNQIVNKTKENLIKNLSSDSFNKVFQSDKDTMGRVLGSLVKATAHVFEQKRFNPSLIIKELQGVNVSKEDQDFILKRGKVVETLAFEAVSGVKQSQKGINNNDLPVTLAHDRAMRFGKIKTLFPFSNYDSKKGLPEDATKGILSDTILNTAAFSIDSPNNFSKKVEIINDQETIKGTINGEQISKLPPKHPTVRHEIIKPHGQEPLIASAEPRLGEKNFIHYIDSSGQLEYYTRPNTKIYGNFGDGFHIKTGRIFAIKDLRVGKEEANYVNTQPSDKKMEPLLERIESIDNLMWKDFKHSAIRKYNIDLNKVTFIIEGTDTFYTYGQLFNSSEEAFTSFIDLKKPPKISQAMHKYPGLEVLIQFRKADGNVLHYRLHK